jgi:hypothetical protein
MVEQTGEEIDWERCPPDWDDFPENVTIAVNIFHTLQSRIYGDVGFTGKDFSNIEDLYKFHYVEGKAEKDWIFEILLFLERRAVEESQKHIKNEMDKIKKK